MSHRPAKRSFWFRGSALAFGGQLTSPLCESLEARRACVLPPTGGFAAAEAGPFDHRNVVRFARAASTVSGRRGEHDGHPTYDTAVTVCVEGLDILGVVTADRIVGRLTSLHREDEEPQISPLGSHFENLRVAGVPVAVEPDPGLARHGRYRDLARACAGRFRDGEGKALRIEGGPGSALPAWKEGAPSPLFEDRLLLTSLFDVGPGRALSGDGEEAATAGRLHVEGFGTLYLGEYLVSRFARRLTMLRVELGCPIEGTLTVGYDVINGHVYP